MTVHQAKKIIKQFLDERGLKYEKIRGRTIDFTDLARASCIFVEVHGWTPNPAAIDAIDLAVKNGFRVQFFGPGIVQGG